MAASLLAGDRADILLDCLQDLGFVSSASTCRDGLSSVHPHRFIIERIKKCVRVSTAVRNMAETRLAYAVW